MNELNNAFYYQVEMLICDVKIAYYKLRLMFSR